MWFYKTDPIDYFDFQARGPKWHDYAFFDEVMRLAVESAALFMQVGWEGDARNVAVFGLPCPNDASTKWGIVIKQKNNGTCFIASSVEIPWLQSYEVKVDG